MPKTIDSLVTGTVVEIKVAPGASVSARQTVVVVESMKMEIPIESSVDGDVLTVHVSVGEAVKQDQVLVTLA